MEKGQFKKYTLESINLDDFNETQKSLLKKLNVSKSYSLKSPQGSIMGFEQLCNCDSGYLCQHRLKEIAKWLKENT